MTRFHNGGFSALLVLALGAVFGVASDAISGTSGPDSDVAAVQHMHDDATHFARRVLMSDDYVVASACNFAAVVADDDDESTCPAGTYKTVCGDEDKCVPCSQCLTLTPDNDTDAREVVLKNTTLGIVSLYTRFGKERYWEDICYPENSWGKTAGDCRCRGLWSGSACDEEGDPTVSFIVSSVMLVVTTILIVVCICFRVEMRSTKYASHHYRDPVMKGALSYSLALQVS